MADYDVSCARGSSLAVVNSSETRAVEVGWYEEPVNVTDCPQTSTPRVLVVKIFDNVFFCGQNTSAISGTPRNDDFSVADANQDGTWIYFRNGVQVGTFGLGSFVTGDPRALGERKSTHDTAYSNFRGLQRMGAAQTWSNWDSNDVIDDTDGGFFGCVHTNIHFEVLADGSAC